MVKEFKNKHRKEVGSMTLVRRTDLFPNIPSFFDDFMSRDVSNWFDTNFAERGTTLPAVNISEKEDEYVVELAAPGMTKKDFNIEYEDDILTVSSEHKAETEDKGKDDYYRREFSYQSFQRSFRFPQDIVDADKIKASYKDGILHLTLPKVEEKKAKPRKQISIN